MRRFVPVALLFVFAACATTTAPRGARFKILQVNDVYKIEGLEGGQSGGLARLRTLRKHLESDGTPVLLLHGGDVLYPSVMSKYLQARPMIDVMNLLDGDGAAFDPNLIVTFGNHEFDNKTPDILLDRLKDSQFRWVSANARRCVPECTERFPEVADTVLAERAGLKIGLVGLMYPTQKSYVRTSDVIPAAKNAVGELRRQGARVIIALTHEDMSADVDLVKQVPGIDLVIGGHDHLYMQDHVGTTWITKADADAKSVIVYDVTVTRSGVQTTPVRVVLDATVPQDPEVNVRVQQWLRELAQKLGGNETIGRTKNLLEGVEPVIRGRESALGNLLADVAREQMQTDIAVINGGSIRINDNIPPGPVTKYDLEGIFYFTNQLVAFRATGAGILDMLRNSVSRADAGDGRFLQVSGLAFAYHPRNGAFVVNPEDVSIAGKPLDVNASYTVATLDYLYLHGTEDGYVLFSDGTRPPKVNGDRDADFRTTVERYLRAKGTVDVGIEGRIVRE